MEIKFRGKNEKGFWSYGCLVNNMWTFSEYSKNTKGEKVCEIITGNYESDNWAEAIEEESNLISVLAESVGQFAGSKDINKTDIYEGDILSEKWKAEVYKNEEGAYMVKFHTNPKANKPQTLLKYLKSRGKAGCSERDCVIIGNIQDNPELLK